MVRCGRLRGHMHLYIYIHIYIYTCVCVCVFVEEWVLVRPYLVVNHFCIEILSRDQAQLLHVFHGYDMNIEIVSSKDKRDIFELSRQGRVSENVLKDKRERRKTSDGTGLLERTRTLAYPLLMMLCASYMNRVFRKKVGSHHPLNP